MGTGKIIILVNNAKIATKIKMEGISQAELGMLISELEIIKQELLRKYNMNRKRFDEQNDK